MVRQGTCSSLRREDLPADCPWLVAIHKSEEQMAKLAKRRRQP